MSVRIIPAFLLAAVYFGAGFAHANGDALISAKEKSKASYVTNPKADERTGRKGDRNDKGDSRPKDGKGRDDDFPRPQNPRPPSRS